MTAKIDYLDFDSINSIDTNGDSFDTTFNLIQKYNKLDIFEERFVKRCANKTHFKAPLCPFYQTVQK